MTNCAGTAALPPVCAYLQLSASHWDFRTLLLTINVACEDKQASVLKWRSSRQWSGCRNIHFFKWTFLAILVVNIQLWAVEVWENRPFLLLTVLCISIQEAWLALLHSPALWSVLGENGFADSRHCLEVPTSWQFDLDLQKKA